MINNYTFSHPCFIRNSTRDLWDKLHRLGCRYGDFLWEDNNNHCTILVADKCYYRCYDKSQIDNLIANGYTDCGTNEDLFIAIAALSEDTDKNQWFVSNYFDHNMNPDQMTKCTIDNYKDFFGDCPYVRNYDDFHKATVEELIKYFN